MNERRMWFFKRRTPLVDVNAERAALAAATAGLDYPSERDAPFDTFHWPDGPTSALDAVRSHVAGGHAFEQVDLGRLFAGLVREPRIASLRKTIEATLIDATAIRAVPSAGAAVEVYVIGRSRAGGWAGVHATSIET